MCAGASMTFPLRINTVIEQIYFQRKLVALSGADFRSMRKTLKFSENGLRFTQSI